MSERPNKPERLPHENLLSTSRSALYRANEFLPQVEMLKDEHLAYIEAMAADMMTVLAKLGDTAKQERERRNKN